MNITFCVLACAKNEKYIKRLNDFFIYGFKNTTKIKIKFVFLVEDETKPDCVPEDHIWYNCPNTPLSCRFLKYLIESNDDSEWVMQVDDDSSTDIDKTYEFLTKFYNYEDSMMLMGGRNTDLEFSQQNIIKIMGLDEFFFGSTNISKFDTHPYFVHAWEPTIISKKAVQVVKEWNRVNEYFDLCLKYRPTFGDQTPYVVAKLTKIPIVECTFMSPFNKHAEYTAINPKGRYSHIHYVVDSWEGFENFKKKMQSAKQGNTDFPTELPKADLWEFWGGIKDQERFYGVINLNEDGTVGLYSNDNEFFWEKEDEKISLLNINKQKTCTMLKISEHEFSGPFIPNPNVNHKIIKVKN